MQRAISG